jgi:hypothetical protein
MDCAVPGSGATNGGDHDELDVDDPFAADGVGVGVGLGVTYTLYTTESRPRPAVWSDAARYACALAIVDA